jgi:hypothetical protein
LSPEDVFKMIPVVGIAKKIIRILPGDKVSMCVHAKIISLWLFIYLKLYVPLSRHCLQHWLNILILGESVSLYFFLNLFSIFPGLGPLHMGHIVSGI